jgi:hypothetical protein
MDSILSADPNWDSESRFRRKGRTQSKEEWSLKITSRRPKQKTYPVPM